MKNNVRVHQSSHHVVQTLGRIERDMSDQLCDKAFLEQPSVSHTALSGSAAVGAVYMLSYLKK